RRNHVLDDVAHRSIQAAGRVERQQHQAGVLGGRFCQRLVYEVRQEWLDDAVDGNFDDARGRDCGAGRLAVRGGGAILRPGQPTCRQDDREEEQESAGRVRKPAAARFRRRAFRGKFAGNHGATPMASRRAPALDGLPFESTTGPAAEGNVSPAIGPYYGTESSAKEKKRVAGHLGRSAPEWGTATGAEPYRVVRLGAEVI